MSVKIDATILKTDALDLGLKLIAKRGWTTPNKTKNIYFPPLKFYSPKNKKTSSNIFSTQNKQKKVSQSCTVKVSFRPSKDLHLKNLEYIEKEGKGFDGSVPEIYGSLSKEEYKKRMVDKNWRIIISPESSKVNLNLLTKNLIQRIENYTGYKLNWVACNHYDTNNPHTHILINGIDKNRRNVNFGIGKGGMGKDFCTKVVRQMTQEICTQMLGHKTQDEIFNSKLKSVNKEYFTPLDKKLKLFIHNNILTKNYLKDKDELFLNKRLEKLLQLELCTYNKNTQCFSFKENWETELKTLGKYNTYYEGYNYTNCAPQDYYLHELKEKGNIEGKILKKFTMQQNSNNFALVIEKKDGKTAYVPLPFYPKDCYVGDEISIEINEKKTRIKNFTNHQKSK